MKNINFKYQIAAGVILIVIGTLALLSDYIKEKRDVVFSEMNLILSTVSTEGIYLEDEQIQEDFSEEENSDEEIQEDVGENTKEENYTYGKMLVLLSLSIHRGLVPEPLRY